jgi:hypothetical protein
MEARPSGNRVEPMLSETTIEMAVRSPTDADGGGRDRIWPHVSFAAAIRPTDVGKTSVDPNYARKLVRHHSEESVDFWPGAIDSGQRHDAETALADVDSGEALIGRA